MAAAWRATMKRAMAILLWCLGLGCLAGTALANHSTIIPAVIDSHTQVTNVPTGWKNWCENHPQKCHEEWCEKHPNECHEQACVNHPEKCHRQWCENHPNVCAREWCENHPRECRR